MNWKVPLSDLDYGVEEDNAVLEVLHSRWLTMGAVTRQFEMEFAQLIGVKHALAVSNATQALHLACLALGIGPGDEVIVPSLSFVATANAVLYTGADVRFADIIGPEELTISPDSIEEQISSKTRAVIVMHYGGYPCRMAEILEIAAEHGLAIIEDAAHAPGASLNNQSLGTWGDIGCFSFFSNKNLATGEGGMLVTDRTDIDKRVRQLRSHGMTSLTWDRFQGQSSSYDVLDLGFNYRIDEIRSALGRVQLKKLINNNALRRAITEKYWQAFSHTDISLPFKERATSAEVRPSFHIFPVLLSSDIDRKKLVTNLGEEGIQTSIHYPPIHQFEYYRQRYPGVDLPITSLVAARELTLPLFPIMRDDQVSQVIESVSKCL